MYVSKEAHYSLQKIGDIQNIETRIIDTLEMGQMDTEDLKRKMSSKSPALVAVAIGGTFKGAIDDQSAISDAIAQVNPPAVYKHLDAALFGGYLPFLKDETARHIVDAKKSGFDSVAVSGHKFLSMNEPIGIFICRKEILGSVNENPVEYLNGTIPTLNCSRSGFDALKLFWRIKSLGEEGLREEADHTLAMAELFYNTLKSAGVECWRNPYSDTIIFRRPRREIIKNCGADMVISVHQNFYPDGTRRGAQVFFRKGSESGKRLAICVQERLNAMPSATNSAQPLIGDYYMLQCTEAPSVIVECGFLSNAEDERLLLTEEYREDVAYAVFAGAVNYFT